MTQFEGFMGNIYGKLGNYVLVKGKKKRVFIRKLVKPGTKKNEPGLRGQYKRTPKLNRYAAEISNILDQYFNTYRDPHRYQQILGRMRKAPSDEHILLLKAMKGFDLKKRYPLPKFVVPKLTITEAARSIKVHMSLDAHPSQIWGDESDYYFELLMIEWGPNGEDPSVDRQVTEWITQREKVPSFQFNFARAASTRRWMLILSLVMGKDGVRTEAHSSQSVRIMEVGSYVEKEKKLLQKKQVTRKVVVVTNDADDVPRVKRL